MTRTNKVADLDPLVLSSSTSSVTVEGNAAIADDNNIKSKDEKSTKDGDDDKPKLPPVPVFQMFRYATIKEIVLIFIGLAAATIAGLALPAMVILFGRLTNAFVYNDLDYDLIFNTTGMTEDEVKDVLGIGDFYTDVKVFGYGVLVIGFIEFFTGYIFVTTLNYAAEGQVYRLRGMFLKSILRQEIGWFDTHQTNDFASRVNEDLNKVQDGIGEKVGMFVFFTTTFIFSIINAFVHGWELTLVILSIFPIMAIAAGLMAKVTSSATNVEMTKYANAGSVAEEVLSSIRTVFCFGGETKEVKRYENHLEEAKAAGVRKSVYMGVSLGLMWLIIYMAYALAFWYGSKLVLEARPTADSLEVSFDPSDLIIIFFSVLMGAMNMGQSAPYIEAFQSGRGAAATIYDVIERKSEIDPTDESGERPLEIGGVLEFHDVHFEYPSRADVKILQGVDIKILQGQTVALVGSSGCGKSTCVQLVQRFYDPREGKVCLGGWDLKSLNLGWLRDHIGIVGQEPVLFATSILENIRYGRDNASHKEIVQAAKEANAHDFIMKMPQQYDTHVGERGIQMSGGQKQRIAIARALVKKPKVLLLDEATSALDNQSEAVVQQALDKASQGRTTLIVAHRLTTIQNADKIIVLQKGQVVEQGTHDELMAKEAHYFSLVKAQVYPEEEEENNTFKNDKTTNCANGSLDDLLADQDDEDVLTEIIEDIVYQVPIPMKRGSSVRLSKRSLESFRASSARRTSPLKSKTGIAKLKDKLIGREDSTNEENPDEEVAPPVSMLRILKLNRPEWYYIAGGATCAVIQGMLMPAFAVLFGSILGSLSVTDEDEYKKQVNLYSLLFVCVGIVAALAVFFQTLLFGLSGEILTFRLRSKAFETMLKQEMGWFDQEKNSVGALCSRLSGDSANVKGATGTRVGTTVQSVTTIVFCVGLSMYYSVKLGSVMLPFFPFLMLGVYLQAKVMTGQSVFETNMMEKSTKIALESISNIRTVASLHKEVRFAELYQEALHKPHVQALRTSHVRGIAFAFANAIIFWAYACVMFYGGHLVDIGEMEFEDVFKVAEAMILGSMVVGQTMAFAPNYNKAKVSAARLFLLFDRRPLIDSSPGVGLRLPMDINKIELKDVHFTYPTRPTQPVLKGMSVNVTKGETIALVGSSGCGKSTIINLLERFYDIKSGQVILNNQNIEALNIGFVRSLLGLVSQEPVLFDRTIAENIAYGDNSKNVSMTEIEKVAKLANIHTFINELPEGYKTKVGDKGTQLSGGQKQRIAIARALVRNPQVLLLDEATSALDAESELIVQEALDKAQKGRTSIIIAHRLSTIRQANKILLIQSGVVVEEGTHEELLAQKGEYYKLYQTRVN